MCEVVEMSDRMKGMKLGNFSGIKKTPVEPTKPPEPQPEPAPKPKAEPKAKTKTKKTTAKSETTTKAKAKVGKKRRDPQLPKEAKSLRDAGATRRPTKGARERSTRQTQAKEELVTVNIKIRKDQKTWLTDTASTVRNNNSEPVPPSERVYPQHLIGVAIDFLEAAGVGWDEVKNVEELREQLNL